MKTSIDLPEPLLREVRQLAKDRGTTTKSLVEQALKLLLEQHAAGIRPYQLDDCSVGGTGLQVEFARAKWNEVRDAAYGMGSLIADERP